MDSFLDQLAELFPEPRSDDPVQQKLRQHQPKHVQATLRGYQQDGVRWLMSCVQRRLSGAVLADDMGLGKTLQSLAFLSALRQFDTLPGPFLVITPLAVLDAWRREAAHFVPHLSTRMYAGSKDARADLRAQAAASDPVDITLTTYEVLMRDIHWFASTAWSCVVIDEAHRLKNPKSRLFRTLRPGIVFDDEDDADSDGAVRRAADDDDDAGYGSGGGGGSAKRIVSLGAPPAFMLLLTGTPLQNDLAELHALLTFCQPDVFSACRTAFLSEFADAGNASQIALLHRILGVFVMRRIKDEVATELPQKTELVLWVGMTGVQKKVYRNLLTRNHAGFASSTGLLNIVIQLRKCCSHPYQFAGVEPEPFVEGEHLVQASGKLIVLDKLLGRLRRDGHRVLLFSQFVTVLDILQDYLSLRSYPYERLDGSVRGEERFIAVDAFNQQSAGQFVFLLSTRAGGLGLNLQSADTVIFFDSDWNPQMDLQAQARAHRIGQDKPVTVYRLVTAHSVDEVVVRRAARKLALSTAVIEQAQLAHRSTAAAPDAGAGGDVDAAWRAADLSDVVSFGLQHLGTAPPDDTVGDADDPSLALPLDSLLAAARDQTSRDTATAAAHAADTSAADASAHAAVTEPSLYYYQGRDYTEQVRAAPDDDQVLQAILAGVTPAVQPGVSGKRRRGSGVDDGEHARRVSARKQAADAAAQQRLHKLWQRNGYQRHVLPTADSDDDDGEDDDGGDVDSDAAPRQLRYVTGDVTQPMHVDGNSAQQRIIVHAVDTSGIWPSRGAIWRGLAALCKDMPDQYAAMKQNRDLALGQAHLLPIPGDTTLVVAFLVVQKRRAGTVQDIDSASLAVALRALARYARAHGASVHVPRLGAGQAGFSWYSAERLLRKDLAARRVPTLVYYYPRRSRSLVASSMRSALATSTTSSTTTTSATTTTTPAAATAPATSKLPDYFRGFAFHFSGLDEQEARRLYRYAVAYGARVMSELEAGTTTHLILASSDAVSPEQRAWLASLSQQQGVVSVSKAWLLDCLLQQRLLPDTPYRIPLAR